MCAVWVSKDARVQPLCDEVFLARRRSLLCFFVGVMETGQATIAVATKDVRLALHV